MRILSRITILLLGIAFVLCALLVFFGVGDRPDLVVGWTLTRDDIVRAKKILHEGAKTKPDAIGTIELSEEDINLATNYLLNRYSKSAVDIQIKNNKLRFIVSMTLPDNPLGKYLNISFRLGNENDEPLPSFTKFKVGKLLLPADFAAWVIDNVIRHSSLNEYFILATRPLKSVQIDDQKVTITYFSNLNSLIEAQNFLTNRGDTHTHTIYQQKLAEIIAQHDPEWLLSLADLLKPLFALAYQRSTLENAIEENKIVIFTINDYVNKGIMSKSSPVISASQKQYPAYLYKRVDLAQHFIGSAAITASANGQISKLVGEEKELSDAKVGSGFSFIDLTADKAGTRFGEMATASAASARKIQQAVSQINDYKDFMPDPRDLPEHMNEEEFRQRFDSINSPKYQEISKLIDARIAALAIYNRP
ncbi:MAG: hypothetical protein Q8N35_15875 [Methylococcaceae bacterium]|jgi:hypothetical protein|nr:hypothetical protein [Methylococcaceae bacterium]MDZ4157270.1 hypothetical protein [Methylococcales bacterium]MDP2392560.1 hypothetical protein [Methylococcaceae bacterium]MDP3021060.1 hypothetical protein [Methylococcaceae bacterium]MDP3388447.1 hypothetical protein [Methylococcaceae bacterium]